MAARGKDHPPKPVPAAEAGPAGLEGEKRRADLADRDPDGQDHELAGEQEGDGAEEVEEDDLEQDLEPSKTGAILPVDDEEERADDGEDLDRTDERRSAQAGGAGRTVALLRSAPRSIVRYDALQAYVNQVRQYSLLTPEEEHELAVRYQETGNVEAARRLVTANLRLVIKIAHEYRKAYRNLLDLIQEGNIGLMHAVKKFDPYRGVKLSSYAAWWIRAYILKFILNNWRLVKIGTTQVQRKLFFNLRKEMEHLRAMGIDQPGPRLLAERLDVPEEEVTSMQLRLAAPEMSLDAPLRGDEPGSSSRLDSVQDRGLDPERNVEEQEFSLLLRQKLAEFGKTLTGRDREIFELRTVADEPLTLQEIGDRHGITRERARQIERRMMDRLKEYLYRELGDAVNVALGIGE